jgi:site-specific recombinase XerD
MPPTTPPLEPIFEAHIQTLALTLRPGSVSGYRGVTRRFLSFLHATFPSVRRLRQLRRDPHLLAWFRSLCEEQPPLSNRTRINLLLCLRRLLDDLAASGHPLADDLIRCEDFPPSPHYLPRPLSPQDDQLLQQELRRTGDLPANALLLTRATGIRIGECLDLALDCLHQIGPDQWALHVPLGKLHTERLVPADADIRQIVARILALRAAAPPASLAHSAGLLLPRAGSRDVLYQRTLLPALAAAAQRAGCSVPVTPHRLRHSFASEMIRLRVSLPALMQLLGHRDIRMTMRYVEVLQLDLQREFHEARQNAAQPHRCPILSLPNASPNADLPGNPPSPDGS